MAFNKYIVKLNDATKADQPTLLKALDELLNNGIQIVQEKNTSTLGLVRVQVPEEIDVKEAIRNSTLLTQAVEKIDSIAE
ncbi:hypothetical protein I350_03598 [Cryptococcus amylolentus CBS 6273]|uniref:Uncharacterized protein n=1 Tax=Cryptococcus amylolentus CBS 6273 TaxID=1296118 RepID=A0A1E3K4S1_9TREE|nr:hypothetical protein I350_03598 [Cryptococcus amylolentus CBS 6273]